MICTRLHKSYRNVLAVCDKELLGKKFEEGKRQLDVRESFYNENELSYEQVVEMMKDNLIEDATFNIVGEKSVNAAVEAGIINPESTKSVQGIPFILVLL